MHSFFLSLDLFLTFKVPQKLKICPGPKIIKKKFMLNSAEHEIFPAHVKMPTVVGMSRKNSIIGLSEPEEKKLNFLILLYK